MLEGMLQMQLDLSVDILTSGASVSSSVNPDSKASQTSNTTPVRGQRARDGENLERRSKDRYCRVLSIAKLLRVKG